MSSTPHGVNKEEKCQCSCNPFCGCICHKESVGVNKDWEEEFDSLVKKVGLHIGYKQLGRIEELKSFFRSVLRKQGEELATELLAIEGIEIDEWPDHRLIKKGVLAKIAARLQAKN